MDKINIIAKAAGPGRGQRGFTVIELLIVMGIMGVLATISYLGIQDSLPRWRLNAAARMLRGDLVDSKTRAARDMREYRLHLSAGGYAMQIGNARAGSAAWATPPPPAPPARVFADDFPGITLSMTDETTDPIFQPSGILRPGLGNLLITLNDNKGHSKVISISMPGRIRIN